MTFSDFLEQQGFRKLEDMEGLDQFGIYINFNRGIGVIPLEGGEIRYIEGSKRKLTLREERKLAKLIQLSEGWQPPT